MRELASRGSALTSSGTATRSTFCDLRDGSGTMWRRFINPTHFNVK